MRITSLHYKSYQLTRGSHYCQWIIVMEETLSLEIVNVRSPSCRRQRIRPISPPDVQLRIAASRGRLHEIRTLLANGVVVSKDSVRNI